MWRQKGGGEQSKEDDGDTVGMRKGVVFDICIKLNPSATRTSRIYW